MAKASFLSSQLFKVIGPGKTVFEVHSDLLVKKSKVLAKAVNGPMRESTTRTIEIEAIEGDVDDDTVMRFLEYVYTANYTTPDPIVLRSPSNSEQLMTILGVETPQPVSKLLNVHRANILRNTRLREKLSSSDKQYQPSHTPIVEGPEPPDEVQPDLSIPISAKLSTTDLWNLFCYSHRSMQSLIWTSPINKQHEDSTPLLMCHAHLYKFSDRYDCPEVMELSLQRLRMALSRYRLYQDQAPDIVELIQYTYQHTIEFQDGHDRLRLLVLDYTTCHIRQLSKDKSFIELLKSSAPLASDLVVKMVVLAD